jgi:hypothetical protein
MFIVILDIVVRWLSADTCTIRFPYNDLFYFTYHEILTQWPLAQIDLEEFVNLPQSCHAAPFIRIRMVDQ